MGNILFKQPLVRDLVVKCQILSCSVSFRQRIFLIPIQGKSSIRGGNNKLKRTPFSHTEVVLIRYEGAVPNAPVLREVDFFPFKGFINTDTVPWQGQNESG